MLKKKKKSPNISFSYKVFCLLYKLHPRNTSFQSFSWILSWKIKFVQNCTELSQKCMNLSNKIVTRTKRIRVSGRSCTCRAWSPCGANWWAPWAGFGKSPRSESRLGWTGTLRKPHDIVTPLQNTVTCYRFGTHSLRMARLASRSYAFSRACVST